MPLTVIANGEEIPYTSFKFSAGEVQVRLNTALSHIDDINFEITSDIASSDDLMELLLVTNAIKFWLPSARIELIIPYFPYSRQDRACYAGESQAFAVAQNLIAPQLYESIITWDIHNINSLSRRVGNIAPAQLILGIEWTEPPANTIVVAPDKGATDRAYGVAEELKLPFVQGDKIRDPKDGKITGMEVYCGDMGNQNFLIVDDICDGGRTFIELAKILRTKTTGKITLYVTHGIFSQGFDVFDGYIDDFLVANLFKREHVPDNVKYLRMMK